MLTRLYLNQIPPPGSFARRHTLKTDVTKTDTIRTETIAENVWNFAVFPQPIAQAHCGSSVAGMVDIGEDIAIHCFVKDDVTLVKHAATCTYNNRE